MTKNATMNFENYCENNFWLHSDRNKVPFKLYDYQKYISRLIDKKKKIIVSSPRQMGLSIFSSMKVLWEIQTKYNNNVVFVTQRRDHSTTHIQRLNHWINNFPQIYEKSSFVINYDTIECVATNSKIKFVNNSSPDSLRGININFLILEDFAWYPINSNFWSPLLHSKCDSSIRVFIYSTPSPISSNNQGKIFKDLFLKSKINQNDFYSYHIPWMAKPGNDMASFVNIVRNFGVTNYKNEIFGLFE